MRAYSAFRLLIQVLFLALWVSCKEKVAETPVNPDPLAYVPVNCRIVAEADLKALAEKTDWQAILDHETFQTLFQDREGYLQTVLHLLMQDGLDRERPAFLFQHGSPDSTWQAIAGTGSVDSLAAQLQRLDMPAAKKAGDLWYTIGNGNTIVWNSSLMTVVPRELTEAELPALLVPVAESAAGNAAFSAFREKPADLAFWADAGSIKLPLPWLAGLLENSPGMHTGIRLQNDRGEAALHIDVEGMSADQTARMDRWFASASGSRGWEQLPAGTPAWISIALPENPEDMGWSGQPLFESLSTVGTEAVLGFHQIKLPQFYPRVSMVIPRRPGVDAGALQNALRQAGLSEGPNRLNIMGLKAQYAIGSAFITASTTDPPASLAARPSDPLRFPADLDQSFQNSPIRAYVDVAALIAVLPLPMITNELRDLSLYAEKSGSDAMAIHLRIRTANTEVYGLDTALKVLMELIPAVQMMNSFI